MSYEGHSAAENPGTPTPTAAPDLVSAEEPTLYPESTINAGPESAQPLQHSQFPAAPDVGAGDATQSRYPFWNYRDLLLFFGLGFPAILIGQLLVLGFATLFHLDHGPKTFLLVPSQFLAYLMLFAVLWGVLHFQYGRPFWPSLGWVDYRLSAGVPLLCGLTVAYGISFLGAWMHLENIETPMQELLTDRRNAVLLAIFGTTLGPLCEELAFRGFMQPLLTRSFGTVPGIVLTALPFGLLHLAQNAFSWRHVLLIGLAGAAFGAMRQITGSTRAATWMHAAYNGAFFASFLAAGGKAGH